MAALDRQNEPTARMAQNPRVAEPRRIRYVTLVNCAITLAAIGAVWAGRETGLYNLAIAGLATLLLGLFGWVVGLLWLVQFFIRDIRSTPNGCRIPLRKLLKRGRNYQADAKRG